MGKVRCRECIYRAIGQRFYACDYAWITGRTRWAVPPEQCRHFQAGPPIQRDPNGRPRGAAIAINPSRRKTRYDWEKAKRLYNQKWSDPKIADAMGCRVQSVLEWRKRENLPPWPCSEQVKARKGAI